jgi:hypothetical protein
LVSTPIVDVVRDYGEVGLVRIASSAQEFVQEIEGLFPWSRVEWLRKVDARLAAADSWDGPWRAMVNNIRGVPIRLPRKKHPTKNPEEADLLEVLQTGPNGGLA